MSISLEICVDSVESAIAAEKGGADRIELCSGLHVGGLTPEQELIESVRSNVLLEVSVMIRPRDGDFVYGPHEIEAMMREIESARASGADGVVLGTLHQDGEVNIEALRRLIDQAWPMQVTFHRAFDISPNPRHSLEQVIAAGASRILTSGGAADAVTGVAGLARLVRTAEGRIAIMAGGGVRSENVRELVRTSEVREIHTSLRTTNRSHSGSTLQGGNGVQYSHSREHFAVNAADVLVLRQILDAIESSGISPE